MKKIVFGFFVILSFLLCEQFAWSASIGTSDPGLTVEMLNKSLDQPLVIIPSKSSIGRLNAMCIFLADQLVRNVNKQVQNDPIVITTFADLNNLKEATLFGRLVAENLIHELQIRKWAVIDARLMKNILINEYGEFSLSREVQQIKDSFNNRMVIAGTYARANDNLVVNVRLIDINNAVILSSGQMMFTVNEDLDELLEKNFHATRLTKIVGLP